MASQATTRPGSLVIDCATCPVRELHCADCMVSTLQRLPEPGLPLDVDERAVVTAFVRAGMLNPQDASAARARRVHDDRVDGEDGSVEDPPETAAGRAVG